MTNAQQEPGPQRELQLAPTVPKVPLSLVVLLQMPQLIHVPLDAISVILMIVLVRVVHCALPVPILTMLLWLLASVLDAPRVLPGILLVVQQQLPDAPSAPPVSETPRAPPALPARPPPTSTTQVPTNARYAPMRLVATAKPVYLQDRVNAMPNTLEPIAKPLTTIAI